MEFNPFIYLNSSQLIGFDSNRTRVLRRIKVNDATAKSLVENGYALSFDQAKHLIRQGWRQGHNLPYVTLDGAVDATAMSYLDVLNTFKPHKAA